MWGIMPPAVEVASALKHCELAWTVSVVASFGGAGGVPLLRAQPGKLTLIMI